MEPLHIVILASRIFPSITPRSFRATELAKELSRQGHNVTLYGLLGDYNYSTFSKETGIQVKGYSKSLWGNTDSDGKIKLNIVQRVFIKLFKKLLDFPNFEYTWKASKALKSENNFDYLISIAHPFAIHWGVLYYLSNNERNFKVWTSDCGDPFMGNSFNKYPSYFKHLEKRWCKLTDYITIPIEASKKSYFSECINKVRVIPQGFDFSQIELNEYNKNLIVTFAYAGNVYGKLRDPTEFLKYLTTLKIDFKFIVYTQSKTFFEPFANVLRDKMVIKDFIPRSDLLNSLSTMDFLINIKNNSTVQQPSKLIDYALTKRPIFQLSSNFEKEEEESFEGFVRGDYSKQFIFPNIDSYDIRNVTENFLKLYSQKFKENK